MHCLWQRVIYLAPPIVNMCRRPCATDIASNPGAEVVSRPDVRGARRGGPAPSPPRAANVWRVATTDNTLLCMYLRADRVPDGRQWLSPLIMLLSFECATCIGTAQLLRGKVICQTLHVLRPVALVGILSQIHDDDHDTVFLTFRSL